jgi:phosphocarrier protein FPr/phosphocarrier protein
MTLDEVPDPVFAGRMLGDGIAIDPTAGVVGAPCAGEIVAVAKTGHSVAIRTPGGVDLLVHVGIDTVQLGGRGFESRCRPGAQVRAGEEILRFDLDIVARGAKSLITPVIVTPQDGLIITSRRLPGMVSAGELLYEIDGTPLAVPAPPAHSSGEALRRTLPIALRQGLHARPAAILSQQARSAAAQLTLSAHGRSANARSVVAIMALGVRCGDDLLIEARGADAAQAIEAIARGIEEALRAELAHEQSAAPTRSPEPAVSAADAPAGEPGTPGMLRGIVAVPGIAVGRAVHLARRELEVSEQGAGAAHETGELARALGEVRQRLLRVGERGGQTRREIAAAHVEFLEDPLVQDTAQEFIAAGKSAGFAWRSAIRRAVAALEQLDDVRLRERADDLLDIEAHVLLALDGEARPMHQSLPEGAVLIADELLPSELTALDPDRLAAICLARGGATSHVAILAAAMDVPMLIGLGSRVQAVAEGARLIVDADRGLLQTAPLAAELDAGVQQVAARRRRRDAERGAAHAEARTRDGVRVEVYANLGSIVDATAAVANGAEGCGLLRTEFLFIDRDLAPDEAEQYEAYQGIATALAGRPLVLRLMDVGGDKPLRYLPLPDEQNPALGLRGVRTALARPDLLRTQLRAALRVQPAGLVQLLVPMVTDLAELQAVRAVVDEIAGALGRSGAVKLGAMIETPAAALTAGLLLGAADFLSIGSNDLTQYTLAMDRGHAQLAGRADALHPAVLRLIAATAAAGAAAGKLVAVCGGAAADSCAAPIFIGLGVRELSVVPAAVPAIKRQIRGLSADACRELAMQCLELGSAAQVRALAARAQSAPGDL